MPNGWGQYSTPPVVTATPTRAIEGTLPPFPEEEALVNDEQKLTPSWRRWFAKQRAWLTDKGAYKPTNYTLAGSGGGAAVSGTPVFQWWKQGNFVKYTLDIQLTGVTVAGGNIIVRPLPFDPSPNMISGASTVRPVYVGSAIAYNGATYSSIPAYAYNNKLSTGDTFIQVITIPSSCVFIWVSGTYVTDN